MSIFAVGDKVRIKSAKDINDLRGLSGDPDSILACKGLFMLRRDLYGFFCGRVFEISSNIFSGIWALKGVTPWMHEDCFEKIE